MTGKSQIHFNCEVNLYQLWFMQIVYILVQSTLSCLGLLWRLISSYHHNKTKQAVQQLTHRQQIVHGHISLWLETARSLFKITSEHICLMTLLSFYDSIIHICIPGRAYCIILFPKLFVIVSMQVTVRLNIAAWHYRTFCMHYWCHWMLKSRNNSGRIRWTQMVLLSNI